MAIMNLTNRSNPIVDGMSDKMKELIGEELLNRTCSAYNLWNSSNEKDKNKHKDELYQAIVDISYKKLEIAKDRNCPQEIIEELATDRDSSVRGYVAMHLNYSAEARKALMNDCNIIVRKAVAYNKNTPQYMKDKILKEADANTVKVVENKKHNGPHM